MNSSTETERIQQLIRADLRDAALSSCWSSASEHHSTYDLYAVEFDDQGSLAGAALKPNDKETQLTMLMKDLQALTRGRGAADAQPLSIIIYTHGWHHSAAPDDSNVIAFRRLLEGAAAAERVLCL